VEDVTAGICKDVLAEKAGMKAVLNGEKSLKKLTTVWTQYHRWRDGHTAMQKSHTNIALQYADARY